jgi:hypothetical protein
MPGTVCRLFWGKPLTEGGPLHSWNHTEIPADSKRWIVQLAAINIRLSAITFDRIGSLTVQPSLAGGTGKEVIVGPLIDDRSYFVRAERSRQTLASFGPFLTNAERYLALVGWALKWIRTGKVDNPVRSYILHLWLRRWISKSQVLNRRELEHCIAHGEPKGDHVMVDRKGNITSVLDWEL